MGSGGLKWDIRCHNAPKVCKKSTPSFMTKKIDVQWSARPPNGNFTLSVLDSPLSLVLHDTQVNPSILSYFLHFDTANTTVDAARTKDDSVSAKDILQFLRSDASPSAKPPQPPLRSQSALDIRRDSDRSILPPKSSISGSSLSLKDMSDTLAARPATNYNRAMKNRMLNGGGNGAADDDVLSIKNKAARSGVSSSASSVKTTANLRKNSSSKASKSQNPSKDFTEDSDSDQNEVSSSDEEDHVALGVIAQDHHKRRKSSRVPHAGPGGLHRIGSSPNLKSAISSSDSSDGSSIVLAQVANPRLARQKSMSNLMGSPGGVNLSRQQSSRGRMQSAISLSGYQAPPSPPTYKERAAADTITASRQVLQQKSSATSFSNFVRTNSATPPALDTASISDQQLAPSSSPTSSENPSRSIQRTRTNAATVLPVNLTAPPIFTSPQTSTPTTPTPGTPTAQQQLASYQAYAAMMSAQQQQAMMAAMIAAQQQNQILSQMQLQKMGILMGPSVGDASSRKKSKKKKKSKGSRQQQADEQQEEQVDGEQQDQQEAQEQQPEQPQQ
jgi:hypothetical protein